MKICPECSSIDVPDTVKWCPFCGYSFAVPKKEEEIPIPRETPAVPQSMSGISQAAQEKKKEKTQETKTEIRVTPKKKTHGFRNFIIIIGIAIGVFKIFTGDSSEDISNVNVNVEEQEENILAGDEAEGNEPVNERELLLSQIEYADQYVLPLSNVMYLERTDLEGLSAEELRIARNELYARHGRIFQDEGLQNYFNSCEWYTGSVSAEEFSDSVFNEYELANRDFIKMYEHELGVNGQ